MPSSGSAELDAAGITDPPLRAAVLFGYGERFSRGVDVDAYKAFDLRQPGWIKVELKPSA